MKAKTSKNSILSRTRGLKNSVLTLCLGGLVATGILPSFAGPNSNNDHDHDHDHGNCSRKVGFIQNLDFNVSELLDGLTKFFPVREFESVVLDNTVDDDGLDAVVDEMEAIVNDMKSRGIDRILIATFSTSTGPFIEGTAGSLGGVHSDIRHPEVIFAADRQGTTSVDNALNWHRPGIDFKTFNEIGPLSLLPDVAGVSPQPQFILATDFSGAVDGQNAAFLGQAVAAGYDVVPIDLDWNPGTVQFDNFDALSDAVSAAAPQSKVGMSFSAESLAGHPPLTRWVEMTVRGLADLNIFDPTDTNVAYVSLNWVPFLGDFEDPGTIPVDVLFGAGGVSELVVDPKGVNKFLVKLGFPDDAAAAYDYDSVNYDGGGLPLSAAFAWLATCGKRNLDSRYTIDENRQHVNVYINDLIQPAGATIFEQVEENLRINPRWQERNSRKAR
jgi:hypothetical protein